MKEQPQDDLQQSFGIRQSSIEESQVGGQAGRDLHQAGRDLYVEQHIDQRQYIHSSDKAKPLNRREYRNRQALLTKVKNAWIKGVLKRSLHDQILIVLGLEERLDAVVSPWSMELGTIHHSPVPLPQNTQVIDLFDDIGEGRSLLILGTPGSGKTTTLLQLARDLIARAEQNADHLIPVVLNLSSWKGSRQPIADWLVEELSSKYQVPKPIGQGWIKEQQLLLLLDGLDELRIGNRDDCVTALNTFQQENGTEMVVCCRIKDYDILEHRLNFQTAIYLRPLTLEQAHHYLDNLSTDLRGLRNLLENDEPLQELAQSPLMLNIMVLTYQGVAAEDLPKTELLEERQKRLFDDYVERMFDRRGRNQQYSKTKSKRWLIWLAKQLAQESQTVFLIEQIQPDWLQAKAENKLYKAGNITITGLLSVLIFVVVIELIYVLVNDLPSSNISSSSEALLYGVLYAIPAMLIAVLKVGIDGGFPKGIEPIESLSWSWKKFRIGIKLGITWGSIVGVIVHIFVHSNIFWDNETWLSWGLRYLSFYGLTFGLNFGLLNGLSEGLSDSDLGAESQPNQGIWRSNKNFIISGIIIGFGTGIFSILVYCLSLLLPFFLLTILDGITIDYINYLIHSIVIGSIFGLIIGLTGALSLGGRACIQHFVLRLVLFRQGHVPWSYARFLDYAAERILL